MWDKNEPFITMQEMQKMIQEKDRAKYSDALSR
jgi:hypothetical protein